MKLVELAALIDRHGAMVTDWPMAEWEAARALLATSDKARAMLTRARSIEVALGRPLTGADAITPERVEGLAEAILARAQATPQQRPRRSPPATRLPNAFRAGWIRYVLPMALGALLGILVGQQALEREGRLSLSPGAGLFAVLEALATDRLFGS